MKKNVHTAGKSRKQKKIMLLLLELLIILLLAIALFITTKLSKIEKNKLDMNDVSINDDLSDETKEAMAHYKTIALFGLDNRSNGSLSKGNSDVIMLANIDTKQHTINLVSVYRDSYLDTGNGTYQKCNAAYAKGGPEQALSMLNTNLDLAITDYVTVDFNAIIECVDLLGGVDITITDDEASLMIGYMKELNELTGHNSTPPASGGTYTLDGVQACAYARIRYGGGDDELSKISFEIKRGSTVGIIGGTGSGKSTLINLIPRFYDVTQGSVEVDGRNVKDYSFKQLRKQIGIVPQQSILFKGTIRDNMKWENPDLSDEDIITALKNAQAYEFVSKLPMGLDSHVEQGGKNFSGGQRQRLCIARAIAAQPKVLILDDSFSALDFATDAALRKALSQYTHEMTVIIVTQRCSTIMNSDLILVLDDGMLVGKGTHKELLKNCETYKEICLSQLSKSEVEV